MSTAKLPNDLSLILDFEKIQPLKPEEVEYLWVSKSISEQQPTKSNWRQSPINTRISSVIPLKIFIKFENNTKLYKQFILPIQNSTTKQLEIQYIQWQVLRETNNKTLQCIITKLSEYQAKGLDSSPHSVLYFYKDLSLPYKENSLNKGLVLMKGEILNPKEIDIEQLQYLVLNLQKFYGILDENNKKLNSERLEVLQKFNNGDKSFDFDKLISLAMNIN